MTDFDILRKLIVADRSVRRFDESRRISEPELRTLVGLTRYCASGRNAQPLRYRLVFTPEECAKVYPHLKWAGYFKDWDGPEEGERPVAYLIQCLDTQLGSDCLCDDGLQLQAITLGATAQGMAGCIIKAFDPNGVAEALKIDSRYKPRYVYAMGYAAENVKIVDLGPDDDFKYFRDEHNDHCVPKRPLSQLIINDQ